MWSADDQAMHDFVVDRFGELRRTAYLMCGDWQRAEDVAAAALATVITVGRRGRIEDLDEYARRVVMATFRRDRRRSGRERVFAAGAVAPDPTVTIPVLAALRQLPPKRRAVVVLRCWQRLSFLATADTLGLSLRVTKEHARRGTARLHELLGELLPVAQLAEDGR